MIDYISTRSTTESKLGFADTALAGLARDGGLFVPKDCPLLSPTDLGNMQTQRYLEVAWRVIAPFIGNDIHPDKLMTLLISAYKSFDTKEIAPIRKLDDGFYMMELFHGPTLAFKDVALQFLAKVFEELLESRNGRITIVGATSGDTGSAAIEAFKDSSRADIVILHPKGRVSAVQRRQMTTVLSDNVLNIAIDGTFDDCQNIVKALFADEGFREEVKLSAVNSINWARILAQVVYYVYAATRLHGETGRQVSFTVPTGNFGNIYAGYIAKSMGAPIDKLVIATNSNDILHRFMVSGSMEKAGVVHTTSPSMDIQVASNFERVLYDLCMRDGLAVGNIMQSFRQTGRYHLDDFMMTRMRSVFASGHMTDADVAEVIRKTYSRNAIIVDPHTAVGIGVGEAYYQNHPSSVMVSLATAHPAKFPEAVKDAIGVEPDVPHQLQGIMDRQERYSVLANDSGAIKAAVRRHIARKGGKH